MPVIDLKLSQTPFSGSGTQRKHEFLLTATSMTDDEIMDWLTTPAATFDGVVERPDGSLLTSPLGAGVTPVLLGYADRGLTDLEYQLERDCDPEHYRITATYEVSDGQGGNNLEPTLGAAGITVSLEVAPENTLLRYSLQTIEEYPPSSGEPFAPLTHQAINMSSDGTIDGVQIPSSPMQVSYAFTQASSWFTDAKLLEISRAVSRGKVNTTTMTLGGISYAAGEVRIIGAAGNISSDGNSTLDLRFGIRENETGITIAGIDHTKGGTIPTGIIKDGWDYLWVLYGYGESSGKPTARPRGAYVERLLPRTDLNAIFS